MGLRFGDSCACCGGDPLWVCGSETPIPGLWFGDPPVRVVGVTPCGLVVQRALCMLWFGDPHAGLVVQGPPCACCGGDPL